MLVTNEVINSKTNHIVTYRDALPDKNINAKIIKSAAESFKLMMITLSADEIQVISQLYDSCSEDDFYELVVELSKIKTATTGESYMLGALVQM